MGPNMGPTWTNMGLNLDPASWLGPKGPGPKWAWALPPRGGFGPNQDAGSRLSPRQGPCRVPCRVQVKPYICTHLGPYYEKLSAPPIPPEGLVYEKIQFCLPLALCVSKTRFKNLTFVGPFGPGLWVAYGTSQWDLPQAPAHGSGRWACGLCCEASSAILTRGTLLTLKKLFP